MKFNINKVICINLKSHNEDQLRNISEVYRLSYDALLRSKQRGTYKIWIEPGGDYAIAALETSNPDDFYICERFCPMTKKERESVKNIKPVSTPKLKKPTQKIVENNIPKVVKNASDIVKTDTKPVIKSKVKVILELDAILDKINISGMSSLCKEELDFLKNYK